MFCFIILSLVPEMMVVKSENHLQVLTPLDFFIEDNEFINPNLEKLTFVWLAIIKMAGYFV